MTHSGKGIVTEEVIAEKQRRKETYPGFIEYCPNTDFSSGRYSVRFARRPDDLDKILRLRFEVFNLELGEGLASSFETQRDEDEYDLTCHHLMVQHSVTGAIVGTYRMQTRQMAEAGAGFYSATEFDLSELGDTFLDNAVELGRACIADGHRNGRVLFLLWKGLADYMFNNNKRYFFGCCSLTSQDPSEAKRVMNYLVVNDYVDQAFHVSPLANLTCYDDDLVVSEDEDVKIPRLMRLYLQYGARIAGRPAIDRVFKTIDYLAVFDEQNMDDRVRRMFTD